MFDKTRKIEVAGVKKTVKFLFDFQAYSFEKNSAITWLVVQDDEIRNTMNPPWEAFVKLPGVDSKPGMINVSIPKLIRYNLCS